MRSFSRVALTIALSAVVVYLCSCAGGGIDVNDPIFPSPEPTEQGIVVDPNTRAITITKSGITVTMEHWSRYRLDRKYTTVDMRSPFYYEDAWKQAFKSEVFHLTVKNDTPRNVMVDLKEIVLEDDREYEYKPMDLASLEYKFDTKKLRDLKTRRGLEKAQEILLGERLGPKGTVPAGKTVSGFLPFNIPNAYITKLWATVVLSKEPEVVTKAYERVEFRFDFIHDPVLRAKQPPAKR